MTAPRSYAIQRAEKDFTPEANWDSPQWRDVFPLLIDQYVWDETGFTPTTQVKLQYTDDYLYVIFNARDRYVRSVVTEYQGNVCRDACVEMFFQPAPRKSPHYFNIETNCGGTMLFWAQTGRLENVVQVEKADADRLLVAHTMPKVVDPEIEDEVSWVIAYRVPFDMIQKYAPVDCPASGVVWRANFYKCAMTNSHPHYGSWSPIDLPRPEFHCPQFFGTLIFE